MQTASRLHSQSAANPAFRASAAPVAERIGSHPLPRLLRIDVGKTPQNQIAENRPGGKGIHMQQIVPLFSGRSRPRSSIDRKLA